MKESTKALWKLNAGTGWRRPILFVHAYVYLKWTDKYAGYLLPVAKFAVLKLPKRIGVAVLDFLIPNYHSKILLTGDAKKVVSLNEDVCIDDSIGEKVIPFDTVRQIFFEHPDHIVSWDCACRSYKRKTTGTSCSSEKYGINTCMAIGEPQAGFVLEHAKKLHPKKLTLEEALDRLEDFHRNGWMHTFWFKDALGDKSYCLCNCCKCCCGGHVINKQWIPLVDYKEKSIYKSSGYVAELDETRCEGCGKCVEACPFDARTLNAAKGKSEVNIEKCYGCSICTSACPNGAISMKLCPEKGIPVDMDKLREEQAELERSASRR